MKYGKLAILLIGTLLPSFVYVAGTHSRPIYDPAPLPVIHPIQDPTVLALMSLSSMYTPMENRESWTRMVCTGMTDTGCALFREKYAAGLWESQNSHIGSSGGLLTRVETLDAETQLWQVQIKIFTEQAEQAVNVWTRVKLGADGRWRLDQILDMPVGATG